MINPYIPVSEWLNKICTRSPSLSPQWNTFCALFQACVFLKISQRDKGSFSFVPEKKKNFICTVKMDDCSQTRAVHSKKTVLD